MYTQVSQRKRNQKFKSISYYEQLRTGQICSIEFGLICSENYHLGLNVLKWSNLYYNPVCYSRVLLNYNCVTSLMGDPPNEFRLIKRLLKFNYLCYASTKNGKKTSLMLLVSLTVLDYFNLVSSLQAGAKPIK